MYIFLTKKIVMFHVMKKKGFSDCKEYNREMQNFASLAGYRYLEVEYLGENCCSSLIFYAMLNSENDLRAMKEESKACFYTLSAKYPNMDLIHKIEKTNDFLVITVSLPPVKCICAHKK